MFSPNDRFAEFTASALNERSVKFTKISWLERAENYVKKHKIPKLYHELLQIDVVKIMDDLMNYNQTSNEYITPEFCNNEQIELDTMKVRITEDGHVVPFVDFTKPISFTTFLPRLIMYDNKCPDPNMCLNNFLIVRNNRLVKENNQLAFNEPSNDNDYPYILGNLVEYEQCGIDSCGTDLYTFKRESRIVLTHQTKLLDERTGNRSNSQKINNLHKSNVGYLYQLNENGEYLNLLLKPCMGSTLYTEY